MSAASGYFAAADYWANISHGAFKMVADDQRRRGALDGANALGRDADGFLAPTKLYEPGSYYGDAFNESANASFVAAARTSARVAFQEAAVRNPADPDTFDGFVKTYIDRQIQSTPAQLQGPLANDFAVLGSQYKVTLMRQAQERTDLQRKTHINGDAEDVLRDHIQSSIAGDAEGMVKAAVDLEASARALEGMGEYVDAYKIRKAVSQNARIGPIVGMANRGFRLREQDQDMGGDDPLHGYLNLVKRAESGGDANAKAETSSATGLYQFIDGTWLDQIKRNHKEYAEGKSDDEILKLRKDPILQRRAMETFTRENAAALREAGIAGVGKGELYLAHFLGAAGAIKVLKSGLETPVEQVVDEDARNANKSVFTKARNVGELRAWAERKMGETAAAATLDAGYGTGADYGNALAADIMANPKKYDLDMNEARSAAGIVQSQTAALSAARVAEQSTRKADLAFDYDMAQLKIKQKIDADLGAGRDPEQLSQDLVGVAVMTAKRFSEAGAGPDRLNTELQGYLRQRSEKTSGLALKVQDLIRTRQEGGRPPPAHVEAVDWLVKKNFGRNLSVFDPKDHEALGGTFNHLGLLPTSATSQLKNIFALENPKDPEQAQALGAAIGFVRQLAGPEGAGYVVDHLMDQVGKKETDRIVELMNKDGSSMIAHNQRLNMEQSNVQNWRKDRIERMGATPQERETKLKELVKSEVVGSRVTQAAAMALSLGGSNAVSEWLAPRTDESYERLVFDNAQANLATFTSPETAVAAARAEADKVSAHTTFLRKPGQDLTPTKRPYAPEAFWPGDVVVEDLSKDLLGKLNELRIRDTSWAKEVGQLAGLAAAAVQQPVLNSDIISKLLDGGFPTVDRDLTEGDVANMIQTGVIEMAVSRKPTPDSKPAYALFINYEGKFLPLPGLERWQPGERPGRAVEASKAGVAWAQRFAAETGLKLPAVLPGMAFQVLGEIKAGLGKIDPRPGVIGPTKDITEGFSGVYDKLKRQPQQGPDQPPVVPPSTGMPYSTQGGFPNPVDE